jgi:hypothetical protein
MVYLFPLKPPVTPVGNPVGITLVTAGTTVYVILLIGEFTQTVCGIVPGGSSVMHCACTMLPGRERIMKKKILLKYLIKC